MYFPMMMNMMRDMPSQYGQRGGLPQGTRMGGMGLLGGYGMGYGGMPMGLLGYGGMGGMGGYGSPTQAMMQNYMQGLYQRPMGAPAPHNPAAMFPAYAQIQQQTQQQLMDKYDPAKQQQQAQAAPQGYLPDHLRPFGYGYGYGAAGATADNGFNATPSDAFAGGEST